MHTFLITAFFLLVFNMLPNSLIYAANVGANVGLFIPKATGSATGRHFDSGDDLQRDYDADIDYSGLGFILEIKEKSKPFFIRSSLNYERCSYKYEKVQLTHNFKRLSLNGAACFYVLNRHFYTLWAGPQMRFALMYANGENNYIRKSEVYALGIGLAPSFGLDIKLSDKYFVGFQVGYRYTYYHGYMKEDHSVTRDIFIGDELVHASYFLDDDDGAFNSLENEFYVNLFFLFNLSQ